MLLILAFTAIAADLRTISLDGISLDRARILDGKPVTVSFIVAKPAYTLLGRTMVGAADRDDGVERGAVLLGRRLDVKEGERLVVRGMLRVIRHRGDVVNGVDGDCDAAGARRERAWHAARAVRRDRLR